MIPSLTLVETELVYFEYKQHICSKIDNISFDLPLYLAEFYNVDLNLNCTFKNLEFFTIIGRLQI